MIFTKLVAFPPDDYFQGPPSYPVLQKGTTPRIKYANRKLIEHYEKQKVSYDLYHASLLNTKAEDSIPSAPKKNTSVVEEKEDIDFSSFQEGILHTLFQGTIVQALVQHFDANAPCFITFSSAWKEGFNNFGLDFLSKRRINGIYISQVQGLALWYQTLEMEGLLAQVNSYLNYRSYKRCIGYGGVLWEDGLF